MLSHRADFRPAWWQRPNIPNRWSAFLSDLPDADLGRGYRRITRSDLLTGNQDRSPDGCARLLRPATSGGPATTRIQSVGDAKCSPTITSTA